MAALVVGNSVFLGLNDYKKTHPVCRERDFLRGTHAEVSAVLRHPYPQQGVLYVARFVRSGRPALAKPCPTCQRALGELGISRVYYTTDEGDWALLRLYGAITRRQAARPRSASRGAWSRP